MNDNVRHPAHYTSGEIECIDAIRAALTPEEFRGYCKGNVMKYVWREKHKGGKESMEKAAWYLALLTGSDPVARKDDAESAECKDDAPDWDDAPEWANWVAQDKDGKWFWYSDKPVKGDYPRWVVVKGKFLFAQAGELNPNWHSTLQQRPTK